MNESAQMVAVEEIVAHLCHCYSRAEIDNRQFTEAVEATVTGWDLVSVTSLYARAEATVRRHFCQWWGDCDNGCFYRRDIHAKAPWQDGWVPFGWPLARDLQPKDRERRSPMMPRDARTAITPRLRRRIFARDRHKCRQCNAPPPLEVDHIIPVSRGGSSDDENLQALCVRCNRRKGAFVAELPADFPFDFERMQALEPAP